MGLYANVIFPRLLDWEMSQPLITRHRQSLLSEAQGEVLEIGFGTGLNLPHYPKHIQKITTVEINAGMNSRAQKRIRASSLHGGYLKDDRLHLPRPCDQGGLTSAVY